MPALLAALLPTLISALVPVGADGIRSIFNWLTGGAGAQPTNVEEAVKLMEAETNRLKVVAELDKPVGNPSQWVIDLRASFRYIGAGLAIAPLPLIAAWAFYDPSPAHFEMLQFYAGAVAGPPWGFIFGERMKLHLKKG